VIAISLDSKDSGQISMIEASILIPTKNAGPEFDMCLGAVFGQKNVGPLEVIVVDSGSTDETLEIARKYAVRIERIPPEEFHHARTRNFAAGLAAGRFLVCLSQDAIPASDSWLATLVGNFEDPAVGGVYGRHIPKLGSSLERQHTLDTIYGEERIVKESTNRESLGYRYYHFSDANSAIRRDVWQATGFPDRFKVFEDVGIAKRILDGGWKIVYEPRASVHHSHYHTTTELLKRYFDIGYAFKHLGIWSEQTRSSMLRDVWKLFQRKLKRSQGARGTALLGASIRDDVAKSVGLFLGVNEQYLPMGLKRRLSGNRLFD
jgi:rhamnosyltransferase